MLPIRADHWRMLIPTFGQQILINQALRGEPIEAINILISALVTLATTVLLVWLAIKLYEREQLIFGTK